MGGRFSILVIVIALGGWVTAARAAQQPANWLGGAGDWDDPTKWSTGVIPDNGGGTTYAVNIDNGNAAASSGTLHGSGPTRTVDSLQIDSGDQLAMDGHPLNVAGPITLNG